MTQPSHVGAFIRCSLFSVVLLYGAVSSKPATAATLNVANHSFESPILQIGDPGVEFNAGLDTLFSRTVEDWTRTTPDCMFGACLKGTVRPLTPSLLYSAPLPDGPQAAYINRGSIFQDTGNLIGAGLDYTLTVAIGDRLDLPFISGSISLFAGTASNIVATTVLPSPGIGLFADFSVSATAADLLALSVIGQSIGIILTNTGGGQINFDNVRLTDSSDVSEVPLPAALPLYGIGLAVMGFIGWRRRRKAAAAV